MKGLRLKLKALSKTYNKSQESSADFIDIIEYCYPHFANCTKIPYDTNCVKAYHIVEKENNKSRPFLPDLMYDEVEELVEDFEWLINNINIKDTTIPLDAGKVNKIIYSVVMSFAIFVDLYAPKSRKTPGTYFEFVLGFIIQKLLPDYTRKKHISLPGYDEKVSTDIVFDKIGAPSLVIPAKFSTRERVVQPYAHQRILDAVFGDGKYNSVLICVNETRRDDDNFTTDDICVPGTIRLFQQHLATLDGIYYLDPPLRYLHDDLKELIQVGNLGEFLVSGIKNIINNQVSSKLP